MPVPPAVPPPAMSESMTSRMRFFSVPGVEGYSLDMDALPENGAGAYTEEPIEVIYRYKPNNGDDQTDSEYPCRANVIYMDENGEILEKKKYKGGDGDPLEVQDLEFEGLEYYEITNGNAVFSPQELNVIVFYNHKTNNTLMYILIAGGAVLLFAALAVILRIMKKRKIDSIKID